MLAALCTSAACLQRGDGPGNSQGGSNTNAGVGGSGVAGSGVGGIGGSGAGVGGSGVGGIGGSGVGGIGGSGAGVGGSGVGGSGVGTGGSASGGSSANGGSSASGGGPSIPAELCRFDNDEQHLLPGGFFTDQLDAPNGDSSGLCSVGELSHALRDIDGDLRPDLVVADHCDIAGVGSDHWEVYLNQGSAFASTPMLWALPNGFFTDQLDDLQADDSGSCLEGELSYATRDMNGDLRPDLVITDRCDIAGVGSDHWLVYLNTASGFDNNATVWSLPGGFFTDQLDDVAGDDSGSCLEGELSFELLDMNADLMPDLVVTDRCDLATVGSDHWQVYLNNGAGFASTPLLWQLPTGFTTDQLDDSQSDSSNGCLVGELSVVTRDINADLRPDLIITDRCDLAEVGSDHWQVYLNNGAGFAATPLLWSLPSNFTTDQLDDASEDSSGSCLYGELSYTLMDADGDLAPDLLVTDQCDIAHTGTTHWSIHRNNGGGFDEARAWTLPNNFPTDALDDITFDDHSACIVGERAATAVDMDGDLIPELVIADDCDIAGVGTTHWRVFGGSCFAN